MSQISYNKLFKLLRKKNLKKTEFAYNAGISQNTLARMGQGQYISMELLVRVCEYLDCTFDDVVEIERRVERRMGYKVVDLFCGAGGLSLGFQNAGFKISGGIEFDNTIIKTHEKNFPNAINICADIRNIPDEEVLDKFKNNCDVIIGGPPCQGFSAANMWQSDEEKIEKNRLFYEYIRFVKLLKPKAFVIENVKQILTRENGYAKNEILKITGELGYKVSYSVLRASDYGVPQKRERAIFVGIRNDLDTEFNFENLNKKKVVCVKDAISDLYGIVTNTEDPFELKTKPKSDYQTLMRRNSDDIIFNHLTKFPCEKVQKRMEFVPQGGNWKDVPLEMWDTQRTNRHSSAYRRLNEQDVSITIDTGHMNYFHPLYNRVPTVRESARIQSFPDDFVFVGNITSQYLQVGNAVPPLMAQAVANEIMKKLKENL